MPDKQNPNARAEPTSPRRRITLLEVLVIAAIGAVIIRIIYHLVYWREIVEPLAELTPEEWVTGVLVSALFGAGYYFLNKRITES